MVFEEPGRSRKEATEQRESLKVTLVSQWYAPEPVPIAQQLVVALARRGWDVDVLTGIPNYPSGKVYPGYRARKSMTEDIGGVTVRRSPLYPNHGASSIKRIANYASWAVGACLFGRHELSRSDLSLVYYSPATAALPSMMARLLHGKPYVLLIQDIWPDSIFATGFGGAGLTRKTMRLLTEKFVQATYRQAAHILVISPGVVDLLVSRGVPREKLSLAYNWINVRGVREPTVSRTADLRYIMYAGNHGGAQDLSAAIHAMADLGPDTNVRLILIGDGLEKPALVKLASEIAPTTVEFRWPVPSDAIDAVMAESDVQLVTLKNDPLFAVTMPSKVQNILARAYPMIAAVHGDVGRVVKEAQAGWSVEPGDIASLSCAFREVGESSRVDLLAMGQRGLDYYQRHMSEEENAGRLDRVLRRVVAKDERRQRVRQD